MKKLSKLTQSISHLITAFVGTILFLICPRLMLNHQKKWAPFMHWDYAHRGLHDNMWGVPENSMPAFKAAVDKGYGIELDVHLRQIMSWSSIMMIPSIGCAISNGI